jgi:hypothetical protein
MWPDEADAWRGTVPLFALFAAVRNSLSHYPVLRAGMDSLQGAIFGACEQALDRADACRAFPGYFDTLGGYQRWLREAAEMGARRHVLSPGPVRLCLNRVPAAHRQLLYWYYADALAYPVIGRVLCGNQPSAESEARSRVRSAQAHLLSALRQDGWDGGNWTFPL